MWKMLGDAIDLRSVKASKFWVDGTIYSMGCDQCVLDGYGSNELKPNEIAEVTDFQIAGRQDETLHQNFDIALLGEDQEQDGENTVRIACSARLDITGGNVVLMQVDLHADANIAFLGNLALSEYSFTNSHKINGPVLMNLVVPNRPGYRRYQVLRTFMEVAIDAFDPVITFTYSCRVREANYDQNRLLTFRAFANVLDYKVKWETAGTPQAVPLNSDDEEGDDTTPESSEGEDP